MCRLATIVAILLLLLSSGPVLAQAIPGWDLIKVSSKTTNYAVQKGDSGTHFDTIGATTSVEFDLPVAQPGIGFCFSVFENHPVKIVSSVEDNIEIGTFSTAQMSSGTPHSEVCLGSHAAGSWVGIVVGTWTLQ